MRIMDQIDTIQSMKVVYLDTSFLSQLCKLESGKLIETTDIKEWKALLASLRHGVHKGALLCPASQFQTQEALLAPELLPQFIRLQLELSKGFFFKDWEDILIHQAANQLLIYMNRAYDINLSWKAFDKQVPPIIRPETTQKSKLEILQSAKAKQKEDTSGRTFDEQYRFEKISFLGESFLLPIYMS